MNKLSLLAIFFLVLTFVAVPAFAAQSEVGKTPAQTPAMETPKTERGAASPNAESAPMMKHEAKSFERASQLIGKSVVNENDETLGKIDDVILDKQGRADFVILSHGGLLGIGDKLVAIPWNMIASAMATEKDRDHLVLNLTKEQVEKAPNFDSRNYPNFADASFRNQVRDYFAGASTAQRKGFTETR